MTPPETESGSENLSRERLVIEKLFRDWRAERKERTNLSSENLPPSLRKHFHFIFKYANEINFNLLDDALQEKWRSCEKKVGDATYKGDESAIIKASEELKDLKELMRVMTGFTGELAFSGNESCSETIISEDVDVKKREEVPPEVKAEVASLLVSVVSEDKERFVSILNSIGINAKNRDFYREELAVLLWQTKMEPIKEKLGTFRGSAAPVDAVRVAEADIRRIITAMNVKGLNMSLGTRRLRKNETSVDRPY